MSKLEVVQLRGLFLVLAVLLVMSCALSHAEEVSTVKPAALYLSLGAADLASTRYAINSGASEANPWMRSHPEAKKLAQAAALTFLDTRLQRRDKRLAWGVRVVAIVGHGWLIHHNLKMAEKARRSR